MSVHPSSNIQINTNTNHINNNNNHNIESINRTRINKRKKILSELEHGNSLHLNSNSVSQSMGYNCSSRSSTTHQKVQTYPTKVQAVVPKVVQAVEAVEAVQTVEAVPVQQQALQKQQGEIIIKSQKQLPEKLNHQLRVSALHLERDIPRIIFVPIILSSFPGEESRLPPPAKQQRQRKQQNQLSSASLSARLEKLQLQQKQAALSSVVPLPCDSFNSDQKKILPSRTKSSKPISIPIPVRVSSTTTAPLIFKNTNTNTNTNTTTTCEDFNYSNNPKANSFKGISHSESGIPELQYSGSFNSKSSSVSCRDQDYSEEKRLLLLSSATTIAVTTSKTTTTTTTNTSSTAVNLNQQQQQQQQPTTRHPLQLSFAKSKSKSNPTTSIATNIHTTVVHHNHNYGHHRSQTVPTRTIGPRSQSQSQTNSSMKSNNSKVNVSLTPHSNLADLINASKKLQKAQGAPVDMGGRAQYTRKAGGSTPSRPISLMHRSKSKSTGMISPQEQSMQHNSPGLYTASSSGSMMPPKQQQHQHQHQHQHQQQYNNQSFNKFNIKRPSNIKASVTTGAINVNATMNPFDDPSLKDDLYNPDSYILPSSSAATSSVPGSGSATPVGLGSHPLQSTSTSSDDPLALFDPLKSSYQPMHFHNQNQQQQQHQRHHQPSPSIDTAQLSELAAALSSLKPQQNETQQLTMSNHQVTLGQTPKESTGTSKSHRRFLSLRGPKSMNVDDMKNVMDSIQLGGVGSGESSEYGFGGESFDSVKEKKEKKHKRAASMGLFNIKRNDNNSNDEGDFARPVTPMKGLRRSLNISSSPSASMTEEEEAVRAGKSPGRRKLGLRLGKGHSRNNSNATAPTTVSSINGISPHHSPSRGRNKGLETIDSNESDQFNIRSAISRSPSTEIKLRSSEHDPSPHQIAIPPISDVLLQAKLCRLMEKYNEVDQNFDFGVLANVSRQDMETFVGKANGSKPSSPQITSTGGSAISPPAEKLIMKTAANARSLSPVMSSTLPNLATLHKPIVESIISSASDLVLSAFYYEVNQNENNITHDTTKAKSPGDRTEVAIFASDVLRQFIVVYQGSAENQAKPIRNRLTGKFKSKTVKNFGSEEALTVFPSFEQGYSQSGVEERVFNKLDELAEQHPFFDVILTGHSYGATLALLGSMKYACSRPAMMVNCIAFGCPKVGALDFRQYVNSLPNLNVTRLEYGFDPWVHAPDNPIWTHVGHTISILQQAQSNKDKKSSNENEFVIKAYKFGNDRPDSAANGKFIGKKGNRQEKQLDHDITSYLNAIDLIMNEGSSWPEKFVGEEGSGVQGLNKEKRLVC